MISRRASRFPNATIAFGANATFEVAEQLQYLHEQRARIVGIFAAHIYRYHCSPSRKNHMSPFDVWKPIGRNVLGSAAHFTSVAAERIAEHDTHNQQWPKHDPKFRPNPETENNRTDWGDFPRHWSL